VCLARLETRLGSPRDPEPVSSSLVVYPCGFSMVGQTSHITTLPACLSIIDTATQASKGHTLTKCVIIMDFGAFGCFDGGKYMPGL
jgi:hypothetical protein